MSQPDDHIKTIADMYREVYRSVHRATFSDWLELDVSMAQLKAMFAIGQAEQVSIGQIAETLGVSLPTASHLVDKLVRADLAERTVDSNDRRYTWICLSALGQQRVTRLRQGSLSLLYSWIEQLSAEQLSALEQGLRALVQVAQSHSLIAPSTED